MFDLECISPCFIAFDPKKAQYPSEISTTLSI